MNSIFTCPSLSSPPARKANFDFRRPEAQEPPTQADIELADSMVGRGNNPKYDRGERWTPMQMKRAAILTGVALLALGEVALGYVVYTANIEVAICVGMLAMPLIATVGVAAIFWYFDSVDMDNPQEREKIAREMSHKGLGAIASLKVEDLANRDLLAPLASGEKHSPKRRAVFYATVAKLSGLYQEVQKQRDLQRGEIRLKVIQGTAPADEWLSTIYAGIGIERGVRWNQRFIQRSCHRSSRSHRGHRSHRSHRGHRGHRSHRQHRGNVHRRHRHSVGSDILHGVMDVGEEVALGLARNSHRKATAKWHQWEQWQQSQITLAAKQAFTQLEHEYEKAKQALAG